MKKAEKEAEFTESSAAVISRTDSSETFAQRLRGRVSHRFRDLLATHATTCEVTAEGVP
jgi:hypothetical protein